MKIIRKFTKRFFEFSLIKYFLYGKENPYTMISYIGSSEMAFKCPLCKAAIGFDLFNIDPVIGAQIVCDQCGSISHVPGTARRVTLSRESKITTFNTIKISAGIILPIIKFSKWYYAHPFSKLLPSSEHSDIYHHYGLWAFCNICKRQYHHNILLSFAVSALTKGFVFNAHSSDTQRDMQDLFNGHCSDCGSKKMIAIMSEIPQFVYEHLSEIKQGKRAFSYNPDRKKNLDDKKKVCLKCNSNMSIESLKCPNCGSIKFIWE